MLARFSIDHHGEIHFRDPVWQKTDLEQAIRAEYLNPGSYAVTRVSPGVVRIDCDPPCKAHA
ncbi:MAG: hypothetical protein ABI592_01160 [Acidobacteriota bacterium]